VRPSVPTAGMAPGSAEVADDDKDHVFEAVNNLGPGDMVVTKYARTFEPKHTDVLHFSVEFMF
jgi:hypothetical protein